MAKKTTENKYIIPSLVIALGLTTVATIVSTTFLRIQTNAYNELAASLHTQEVPADFFDRARDVNVLPEGYGDVPPTGEIPSIGDPLYPIGGVPSQVVPIGGIPTEPTPRELDRASLPSEPRQKFDGDIFYTQYSVLENIREECEMYGGTFNTDPLTCTVGGWVYKIR